MVKAPSWIFEPSDLDNIEDIELYRPGGFHPVHISDTLDSDRYQVVHKLGYGGFSTVWLCRDRHLHQYVAIKILTADESNRPLNREFDMLQQLEQLGVSSNHPGKEYVPLLTRHFQIDGPNGSHRCLVLRAAGPSISTLVQGRSVKGGWMGGDLARGLALQVTQGLAYLHLCGIGHGGSNVLIDITETEFHTWPQNQVYEIFGKPVTNPMRYISHAQSGDSASAPSYVVEPIDFSAVDTKYLDPRIQIIDLGQSFYLDTPPTEGVGTPIDYRAPELIFNEDPSSHSDVWALGCLIFEIRTGQTLFEAYFGNKNEVLTQMVNTLGNLPEPWWSAWDERREDVDKDVNYYRGD
ncbi:hypothetical protein GALMADRAFT_224941 [Galerina marginata CBS 339.88]|uniref:non-specific serine/threonine protein kinase n=1 Tax=Galerina marginata (strain CBS 339.88) TaxID=685588 RepID=A0A067T5P6_GALM3|nr:hypothetical protein GALMADRAFT_224941 [Galerina marginata CBS 339.88]